MYNFYSKIVQYLYKSCTIFFLKLYNFCKLVADQRIKSSATFTLLFSNFILFHPLRLKNMPVQYRIGKRKNNLDPSEPLRYMMQAVHTGEIDSERLAYEISNESTLSQADVVAVLKALGQKVQFHLSEGRVVELDNLGRFKVGFKSESATTIRELSPTKVKKFHINYQPSRALKKWLRGKPTLVKEPKSKIK